MRKTRLYFTGCWTPVSRFYIFTMNRSRKASNANKKEPELNTSAPPPPTKLNPNLGPWTARFHDRRLPCSVALRANMCHTSRNKNSCLFEMQIWAWKKKKGVLSSEIGELMCSRLCLQQGMFAESPPCVSVGARVGNAPWWDASRKPGDLFLSDVFLWNPRNVQFNFQSKQPIKNNL